MAKAKTQTPKEYGNDSIKKLKGADRVRKRPAVIFGSDGIEGCEQLFSLGAKHPTHALLKLFGECYIHP